MKKILLAALIFSSCTKETIKFPSPVNLPVVKQPCTGLYFIGNYKVISTPKYDLLDSVTFVRDKQGLRAEFPQQTRYNDTALYYYAPNTCDSLWAFYMEFSGVYHYVRFEGEILVDSLVVAGVCYDLNHYSKY